MRIVAVPCCSTGCCRSHDRLQFVSASRSDGVFQRFVGLCEHYYCFAVERGRRLSSYCRRGNAVDPFNDCTLFSLREYKQAGVQHGFGIYRVVAGVRQNAFVAVRGSFICCANFEKRVLL